MSAPVTDVTGVTGALAGPLGTARLAELEPAGLVAAGQEKLVLPEPVPLGEDDEFDVRFVRLLRESMTAGLRVDWTTATVPFDEADLYHLQPPRQGPAGQWRDEFRYGRCYYRRGPGFVLLKDTRDTATGARFRLDQPEAVAAFWELTDAVHEPSASAGARELAGVLAAERLIFRRGSWLTLLPFRIRIWPVPFDLV